MNRNVESHFAELPSIDIQRSMFDRSCGHKTSFNVADLVPFFWDEVLPGDTFNVTTSAVVRLQTLLTPIMDNVYLDTYFFFVPARLTWTHWREFMGENTESAWIPQTEYSVPLTSYPSGGFDVGTIADYMGVPTGVESLNDKDKPMSLPFRAYALICNEWFRSTALTDPLNIPLGDSNTNGSNGSNYITDVVAGGKPFKVAKYHDYFTSALPSPQLGNAVDAAIMSIDKYFPVGTLVNEHDPLSAGEPITTRYDLNNSGTVVELLRNTASPYAAVLVNSADHPSYQLPVPVNLWAKVDATSTTTVNELRLAFQMQKYYEKLARGGNRYREILLEMFGTHSPDARMMIPEYLGGHRFPLAIHQIANQSQGESDFLGDLGAMSNTADVNDDFVKSFTEHGFIIGVCCVRYDHSYPQGLEKAWSRRTRMDYYWPVFANIGELPIRKREICLVDAGAYDGTNEQVFGYQEAWADYRYKPNRVSSEMRPQAPQSLASWHLADDYATQPSLSDEWIREDKTNVDRVLAVTSEVSNQVFADFYVKNICTRPMPMYSVPGLIDHH